MIVFSVITAKFTEFDWMIKMQKKITDLSYRVIFRFNDILRDKGTPAK